MAYNSGNRIDPDLLPENIKKGINIFGVDGTLEAKVLNGSLLDNLFSLIGGLTLINHTSTSSCNMYGYSVKSGVCETGTDIYFCTATLYGLDCSTATEKSYGKLNILRMDKSTGNFYNYNSQLFLLSEKGASGNFNRPQLEFDGQYITIGYVKDTGVTTERRGTFDTATNSFTTSSSSNVDYGEYSETFTTDYTSNFPDSTSIPLGDGDTTIHNGTDITNQTITYNGTTYGTNVLYLIGDDIIITQGFATSTSNTLFSKNINYNISLGFGDNYSFCIGEIFTKIIGDYIYFLASSGSANRLYYGSININDGTTHEIDYVNGNDNGQIGYSSTIGEYVIRDGTTQYRTITFNNDGTITTSANISGNVTDLVKNETENWNGREWTVGLYGDGDGDCFMFAKNNGPA